MNRGSRSRESLFACVALGMIALDDPAVAADMPLKGPAYRAVHNWTGFYLGGHVGYGGGSFGPGANPLPLQGVFFPHSNTGLIGGYQAGYNFQLPNNLVFGAEVDVSLTSTLDRPGLVPAPFNTTVDYSATARARIGYAFGTLLPYVTGGVAWARTHVDLNDVDGNVISARGRIHAGWTAGAGIEYAANSKWSGKLEYSYIDLGGRTYGLADVPLPDVRVDPNIHTIKLGLNYKIWDGPASAASADYAIRPPTPPASTDWNVHAQTTVISQGYPSFRSPYQGENSLPGAGRVRETWTVGAFLGWRLWEGGELYFGPELAQGFGIGGTLGLAGFSNGEAQKGGAEYPKFRAQRYSFRQTFGLGGEQEDVADAPNQLQGKRDIDRITVNVGKICGRRFL